MWNPLPLFAILCAQIRALQITSLVVPPYVVNSSGHVELDCQYTLTPFDLQPDSGLVVKWFFNNGPAPVYQWIPSQRPQDLGILKGRLDLEHRASDNNATMFRALLILNPTTELSGEYRCAVSTFADEDFMIEKMIVYAPEKRMEFTQSKPSPERVNLTCRSQGLYPEPRIALYKEPFTPKQSKPLQGVTMETSTRSGHYDILATALIHDADAATAPLSATTFVCEVCIPATEYCRRKRAVYYPGSMASFTAGGTGLAGGWAGAWLTAVTLSLLH